MRYPRIIILLALLGTIIIGSVFTYPKHIEYLKVSQDLANKKMFLTNQALYYQEIEENFKKMEEKREKIDKIIAMLPTKLDYASLINYLRMSAFQYGLFLETIQIEPKGSFPQAERIKQYQISLALSGSYPSFKNFLSALEKSARLFGVENISFSAPKEKEIYNFNLQLIVYSYQ